MAQTFKYGDKVEVRDGPKEQWIDGIVVQVQPLKVGLGQALGSLSSAFEFPHVRLPAKDTGLKDGGEDRQDEMQAGFKKDGGEDLNKNAMLGKVQRGETRLTHWNPEDADEWEKEGKWIAYRNLFHSTTSLVLAFCIWNQWAAVSVTLIAAHKTDPNVYSFGYTETVDHTSAVKLLAPIAGISGATCRVVHTWSVNICGGRTTTVGSLVCIAFSMFLAGLVLLDSNANIWGLYFCAILSGVGGGIFSSSVSNISFFCPNRLQGTFLGINGGIGNLGVALTARVVPFFGGIGVCVAGADGECNASPIGGKYAYNPFFFWGVLAVINAMICFRFMNNMPNHGKVIAVAKSAKEPCTTFSSYIADRLVSLHDTLKNNDFKYFFMVQGAGYFASLLISLLFIASNPVVFGNAPLVIVRAFLLCPLALVVGAYSLKSIGWFQPHIAERLKEQMETEILKDGNTVIMCALYIMTFGSFIGYSRAFAELIAKVFSRDPVAYSWLGPFFGSIMRVAGGVLADRLGGAALTQICATIQVLSTLTVAIVIRVAQSSDDPSGQFGWFVFFFVILFTATGLGNASTFKQMATLCSDNPEKRGVMLGFTAAVAAYCAFIIPTLTSAGVQYGFVDVVFYAFAIYYGFCAFLNYFFYFRTDAPFPC